MSPGQPICTNKGFTLIEVLASLGLCVLLATATASAVAFASRAERVAARDGQASLLVQTLYASQRLRPDDLPVAPRGWRIGQDTSIVKLPDEALREWHLLSVAADAQEMPPFTLCILDDRP